MNTVYLIIFFFGSVLFSQLERYYKIPYIKWLFIVPFCLIIANRDISVPDTENYYGYLNSETAGLSEFLDYGFEIGFQTYTKILKSVIQENEIWYFALITISNLLIIEFSVKRISNIFKDDYEKQNEDIEFLGGNRFFTDSHYSIIPLTLYVAFYGIYVNAIVLRQGIAFSILVYASTFAIKEYKNTWDYLLILLLILLAYLFHATAAIGILLILVIIFTKEFSTQTYLKIWIGIGVVYFTNLFSMLGNTAFSFASSLNVLSVLSTKLSNYEGGVTTAVEGVSMKFVFFWVMTFVLIINRLHSRVYFKYLNVLIVGLIFAALFRSVLLVERVSDFFLLFSFVLFYLFLLFQRPDKFWYYYISIILIQLVFVLRITNREMI